MKHKGAFYTNESKPNPVLVKMCSDRSKLSPRGVIDKRSGAVTDTHNLYVNYNTVLTGKKMHVDIKGYPVYSEYRDGYMFEGFTKFNGLGIHLVAEDSVREADDADSDCSQGLVYTKER